ncbi:tRNA 2-thiouridine(34) synthase MnmA [bacterium]|nr:tRNA 2-thiouridine(34) synthase MnmA [bacterium]
MKIAMLLSGGVDSSAALALLKEAGHDVYAFYLKIWLEDELASFNACPWEEDVRYARKVCEKLSVPFKIIPLQKEYSERIITYTISETRAGRTPNPDMLCNPRIKFGAFYDAIRGYDKIATGHYAQIEQGEKMGGKDGFVRLKRSADTLKDQTYFLSQLSQEQLARALFPIGHLQKKEVRGLAEKFGLPNAKRKDSQGLCFLGKIEFDEFLKKHLGEKEGELVEKETGKILGEHNGFWFYTIGQRHGMGLSGGPWYVAGKDVEKNIVFVSREKTSEGAARKNLTVRDMHWISSTPKNLNELTVKIRHGKRETPCTIARLPDISLEVTLSTPEEGIAPGQFAVFYQGEYCLGGGVIA